MFQIKICGVTCPADAALAAESGADAIGLNFYAPSPRSVDSATAQSIVSQLPAALAKVGVFVNTPTNTIRSLAEELDLDWVQLHGDEPPDSLVELGDLKIIRAYRLGANGWHDLEQYLGRSQQLGRLPDALLIDAHVDGQYGGSGESVDWPVLAPPRPWAFDLPVILAGGLHPANVAMAIQQAAPDAVDTASGVESSPGVKDKAKVTEFAAAARGAFSTSTR